ncbi:MAG: bacillithiol biosynthesis cysteine-adding enzyme BshC [Bacteroidota bacterium]
MQIHHFPFDEIPQFSARDIAYTTADERLRPFYKYEVTIEAFEQVFQDKSKANINREVLVEVLKEQYEAFKTSDLVLSQIEKLREKNTFTVVTAHQPSLFTGPLYFIYKIFSAINLAEQLNAKYSDRHIVPIFVIGGEDHDFNEINHAHLFSKELLWVNEEKGAVGAMKTASLQPVLAELKEILGNSENATTIYEKVVRSFTQFETYGQATQNLVHELFQQYGLVVLGMNNAKLKRLFIPQVKEEIFEQPSQTLIQATQEELIEAGFGGQAHPREINFFYLADQIRSRIVLEDDIYKVLDTDLNFTRAEMEQEIENHPERFSPNVVMRPIYQEVVLPNLAYVGGGGELAYWQERQSQFAHFGINFPMLVRRNSALWIDKGNAKKLNKIGFDLPTIFDDTEELIKAYVKENTENELSLKQEKLSVQQLFEGIVAKAIEIDPGLKKTVLGEQAKLLNSISALEAKLMRAEKNRHEITINQIRSLKERLFPSGLQERYDNFMAFYLKQGDAYFETLKSNLNPLDKRFLVFLEE